MLIKKYLLDIIFLIFISILCYLIFFQGLGDYTLRMWDEDRIAINAYEMINHGNPLVPTFNYAPDFFNAKPPLFTWIVAIFFKVLGVSELSLRLPSAIAASLVGMAIYIFSALILKNRWIGIFGTLILLSSFGFSDIHIGRSGDFDALLTLWVFIGSIAAYLYIEKSNKQYLYLAIVSWILAVMTKGVAGLFLIPGIFLYALLTGKIKKILKDTEFWKVVGVFVLIIGGYYFLRNFITPGYLSAVWEGELLGRYGQTFGTTESDFLYYWNYLKDFRFQHWIYFVPISLLSIFLIKDKITKHWVIFSYILTTSYFLIISFSQTKQIWYDAQIYPFMSILVATFIISLVRKLPPILWIIPIIVIAFYTQRYIRTNLAYVHRPDIDRQVYSCVRYGYLLRNNSISAKNTSAVHKDANYCMPLHFYMKRSGINIIDVTNINSGNTLITCDDSTVSAIEENFAVQVIKDYGEGCLTFKVTEKL